MGRMANTEVLELVSPLFRKARHNLVHRPFEPRIGGAAVVNTGGSIFEKIKSR